MDLKPCPFCGGEAEIIYLDYYDVWGVKCQNKKCPAYCDSYERDLEEAINDWNRKSGG